MTDSQKKELEYLIGVLQGTLEMINHYKKIHEGKLIEEMEIAARVPWTDTERAVRQLISCGDCKRCENGYLYATRK